MPRVSYPSQSRSNGIPDAGARQSGGSNVNKTTAVSLSNIGNYNKSKVNVYGIVTSVGPLALDKIGKHSIKIRIVDESSSSVCTVQLHSVKASSLPKPRNIGDIIYVSDVQVQVSHWNAIFLGNYSPETSLICMRSWESSENKFTDTGAAFPDPKRVEELELHSKECLMRDCSVISNKYTYTLQQCYQANYADVICFVLDINDSFCILTDSSLNGETRTLNIEKNLENTFRAEGLQINCCYKFFNLKVERFNDGYYLNFFCKSSLIKVPSYSRAFEQARGYSCKSGKENRDVENVNSKVNQEASATNMDTLDSLELMESEKIEYPKRFCGKILDIELSQRRILPLDSILDSMGKLSPEAKSIFRARVRVLDYFPREPSQMVRQNECSHWEYRLCFRIADLSATYECYLMGPEAQNFFKKIPAKNMEMVKNGREQKINSYFRTLLSQDCWIDCGLKYFQCIQTNRKALQLVKTEFLVPRL